MTTETDVDATGQLLSSQLMSLDGVRGAGRQVGRVGATITVEGGVDDLPSHLFKIAARFDLDVIHRQTSRGGRGDVETLVELAGEERRDEVLAHSAEYDQDVEVLHDVGGDKCLELVTDGGREAGDVVAIVGCGSAKRDLEDDEAVPIEDLYTSGYFAKKREFAEELSDRWYVLSAEYALVKPWLPVEHYEKTIGDLEGVELEKWKRDVGLTLLRVVGPYDRVVVLGGRDYVNALHGVIDEYGLEVALVDPFEETSGIGDQNGWMEDAIAAGNPFHPVGEATPEIATDGGQDVEDDLDYWERELRAFLESYRGDFEMRCVEDVDDVPNLVAVETESVNREERAEMIHRLDMAGFEVISTTEEPKISVRAADYRLEYPYSETSGVGDDDLMTDGRGFLNPIGLAVGMALVTFILLVTWVLAGGSL